MKRKMGTFYTQCVVLNHLDRVRAVDVKGILVDTGSENTWIATESLLAIGVSTEKKSVRFQTADGRTLEREVGFAIVRVGSRFTIDEVVFGLPGDLQILGARTLEGLNLAVDPARKRLIAAGPLPAAALT
ncbi:MAG: aspartyl protease family protein [Elusimicrobiota bacterium]